MQEYETMYKAACVISERSGRHEVRMVYLVAKSFEKAKEKVKKTFPKAHKIVVRRRY